jgi:hypothetical protein
LEGDALQKFNLRDPTPILIEHNRRMDENHDGQNLHPSDPAGGACHPLPGGFYDPRLNILVIPALFWYKRTLAYGYVLNGFLCIIGTVTMGHFAIARWSAPTSPPDILLKSMLIDILIVWGKFFVGKALFDLETFGYDPNRPKAGITYRYPNMGWWLIHLAAVSFVYYLGNRLWS